MTGLNDYSKANGGFNINIEIAILTHDIDLTQFDKSDKELEQPEYNEDYTDMSKDLKDLTPPFLPRQQEVNSNPIDTYKNMVGYFYIPVLMPLIEKGEPTELEFSAPDNSNIMNGNLKGKSYKKLNYISLVIPKYILLNFKDKVPEGTKFLCCMINGDVEVQNIHIIGIHSQELKLD